MARVKIGQSDWPDLFDEPEAWRDLQEQARNERDPKKLEAIIAEMNRLLGECEKKAAAGEAPRPTFRNGHDKLASNPE